MGASNSVVPTQGCCSTGIFGAKNYTPYMTDSESDSWSEYESPKPRKKSRKHKKSKKKRKKKKKKSKKKKHKHTPGKVRKVKTDPMHINTEKRHKLYAGHYHVILCYIIYCCCVFDMLFDIYVYVYVYID